MTWLYHCQVRYATPSHTFKLSAYADATRVKLQEQYWVFGKKCSSPRTRSILGEIDSEKNTKDSNIYTDQTERCIFVWLAQPHHRGTASSNMGVTLDPNLRTCPPDEPNGQFKGLVRHRRYTGSQLNRMLAWQIGFGVCWVPFGTKMVPTCGQHAVTEFLYDMKFCHYIKSEQNFM